MESRRASPPSAESIRSAVDKSIPLAVDIDAKTAKSKKTSLPTGAIRNIQPETPPDTVDTPKLPEKNGWDIESLFGSAEHKKTDTDPADVSTAEKLTDPEAREVVDRYVSDRSEAVDAELSDADEDSPLTAVVSANQVLLEKLRDRAKASEQPVEKIIADATQSTIEELRLTEDDETDSHDATAIIQKQPHRAVTRNQEAIIASILAEEETADSQPVPSEEGTPTTASAQPSLPLSRPPAEVMASREDSLQTTEDMPVSNDLQRSVHEVHAASSAASEAATSPVTAAQKKPESSLGTSYTRGDVAAGVLVGGVAGYMIGRRGGRKRAEAAAKPVHEKLIKEVGVLQQKIVQNEQLVRSLAANKAAREHAEKTKPQAAYQQNAPKPPLSERKAATEVYPPRASLPARQTRPYTSEIPRQSYSEVRLETTKVRPEKLPDTAQRAVDRLPVAKQSTSPPRQEQLHAVTSIDKMPLADVLVVAKQTKIEGEPLSIYYERGQLTERAVRKILIEQRRTGRAERAFYTQMSLHERSNKGVGLEKTPEARGSRPVSATSTHATHAPAPPLSSVQSTNASPATRDDGRLHADPIHADNTRRIGVTPVILVILAVILAFFLLKVVLS